MNDDIIQFSAEDFAEFKKKVPSKPRHLIVRPVAEYSCDGIFLNAYDSVRDASRETGISTDTIRNVVYGNVLCTSERNGRKIFLFRGDDIDKRLAEIEKRKDDYKTKHPHSTTRKEVCEYTLGGRLLFKYPAIKEAAIVNGIKLAWVHSCIRGSRLFIDKRIFLLPEQDIKQRVKEIKAELYRLSKKRPKYREVDVYTLEGKFIKAYPSASAAGKELNIHVSDITRCCNGGDKWHKNQFTAKGRVFLWVGDSISDRLEMIKCLKDKKK